VFEHACCHERRDASISLVGRDRKKRREWSDGEDTNHLLVVERLQFVSVVMLEELLDQREHVVQRVRPDLAGPDVIAGADVIEVDEHRAKRSRHVRIQLAHNISNPFE